MRRSSLPTASPEPRPFLVTKGPGLPSSRSPLEWWHLLSLDAPTVAAVWTVFLAWCAGVHLRWADPFAMFLAVWILYAADRLLDARPLQSAERFPGLEERHRFHHRHRSRFVSMIFVSSLVLALLLHRLLEAELHLYIVLACLLSSWLVLVHARPAASSINAHRLPKELAVGLFFPAAVFIPTVARAPWLRTALLPCALAFALVCTLNCLYLFAWEHPLNRSYAHLTTQWGARHLRALPLTILLFTTALAVASLSKPFASLPHAAAAPAACALSAALLLILHRKHHLLASTMQRALADLALLTPLLLWGSAAIMRLHG